MWRSFPTLMRDFTKHPNKETVELVQLNQISIFPFIICWILTLLLNMSSKAARFSSTTPVQRTCRETIKLRRDMMMLFFMWTFSRFASLIVLKRPLPLFLRPPPRRCSGKREQEKNKMQNNLTMFIFYFAAAAFLVVLRGWNIYRLVLFSRPFEALMVLSSIEMGGKCGNWDFGQWTSKVFRWPSTHWVDREKLSGDEKPKANFANRKMLRQHNQIKLC